MTFDSLWKSINRKLTKVQIEKLALTLNAPDVQRMQASVLDGIIQMASIDEKPNRYLCPQGVISWSR